LKLTAQPGLAARLVLVIDRVFNLELDVLILKKRRSRRSSAIIAVAPMPTAAAAKQPDNMERRP
jgi:hypothetical protein